MFEQLHAMGLQVVLVDDRDTWAAQMLGLGLIRQLVEVPGVSARVQDACLADAVVQALAAAGAPTADAVYNAFNKYLLLSSLVAERLGVTTNPYDAVRRCVFKHETRKCLVAAGLEDWLSFSVVSAEDMAGAVAAMRFPAVLKPAKGSGSSGVVKVGSAEEAMDEFFKRKARGSQAAQDEVLILEEYIDGPEVGVEIVMQAGAVVFCSVMDAAKQSSGAYFQGTGRSYPSSLSPLVQAMVSSHCIAAVTTLGLTSGVLDMDVRYSEASGPRVLEVNARMGGGSVAVMHSIVYGLDLVDVHLRALLGCSVRHLVALMPSYRRNGALRGEAPCHLPGAPEHRRDRPADRRWQDCRGLSQQRLADVLDPGGDEGRR